MPSKSRRREPFHWLNDHGEAICTSPDERGSSDAFKVHDHPDHCFNCLCIVEKVHGHALRWR